MTISVNSKSYSVMELDIEELITVYGKCYSYAYKNKFSARSISRSIIKQLNETLNHLHVKVNNNTIYLSSDNEITNAICKYIESNLLKDVSDLSFRMMLVRTIDRKATFFFKGQKLSIKSSVSDEVISNWREFFKKYY